MTSYAVQMWEKDVQRPILDHYDALMEVWPDVPAIVPRVMSKPGPKGPRGTK